MAPDTLLPSLTTLPLPRDISVPESFFSYPMNFAHTLLLTYNLLHQALPPAHDPEQMSPLTRSLLTCGKISLGLVTLPNHFVYFLTGL